VHRKGLRELAPLIAGSRDLCNLWSTIPYKETLQTPRRQSQVLSSSQIPLTHAARLTGTLPGPLAPHPPALMLYAL
jgi:hypothetical protein